MRFTTIASLFAAGLLLATAAVSSQADVFIPPTSPDGPGTDVLSAFVAQGIGSDPNADQIDAELFTVCPDGSPSQSILFQFSAYSNVHRLGIYAAGDPGNITYIVGGATSGLPMSASISPSGLFGLALDTPNGVFYSQTGLNADGVQHSAAILDRDAQGNLIDCSYIVVWEDLYGGGDVDYNDIAIRFGGVTAVPEPGSIALLSCLGIVGTGLLRRRRHVRT